MDTTDKIISGESSENSRECTDSSRVSSSRNLLNILPTVEHRPLNGRVIGTKSPHIPVMLKKIIGEAANLEGGNKAFADAFGIGEASVKRAKKDNGELKEEIDMAIHNTAVDRIAGMFETCLVPENLAKLDAKDATRAMKDLSKVAGDFGGRKATFNGPTIIIYSPTQHSEQDYDVIDVEAREVK